MYIGRGTYLKHLFKLDCGCRCDCSLNGHYFKYYGCFGV